MGKAKCRKHGDLALFFPPILGLPRGDGFGFGFVSNDKQPADLTAGSQWGQQRNAMRVKDHASFYFVDRACADARTIASAVIVAPEVASTP